MSWLALLAGVVKFASVVATMMQERQLLDAGSAKAIVGGLDVAMAFIKNAQAGADGMRDNGDPDWAARVRDKYKRK